MPNITKVSFAGCTIEVQYNLYAGHPGDWYTPAKHAEIEVLSAKLINGDLLDLVSECVLQKKELELILEEIIFKEKNWQGLI
jgi:hypothetical protein